MLNIEINLNKHTNNEGYCSPTILVSEDNSNETCPIILPEDMPLIQGSTFATAIADGIREKYNTVKEVKEFIYGE